MTGRRVPVEANKRGTDLPQARLDEPTVALLRKRNASGESVLSLHREIGLSYGAIWKAVNFDTWRHVR